MNVIVADHTGYIVVRVVGYEDMGRNLIGLGSVQCLEMQPSEVIGRFRRLSTGRTVKIHAQIIPGRDGLVEFRVLRIVPAPSSDVFEDLRVGFAEAGIVKCAADNELIRLSDEVRERLKTAEF
jgi:hypothetical protein